MAQIYGDTGNIYGGTSGALQALLADSVNNVFSTPPKAAMTFEGDFVPTAATVKAKPITGYNVFPFPSINGSAPAVVGGGDTVVMFKDTPGGARADLVPGHPRGGHDLGQAGRLLLAQQGRAGECVSGCADAHDRDRRSPRRRPSASTCPTSLRRPSAARPGQGEWKILQDFLKNPKDVNGTASKLETAAAAAYKK